MKKNSSKQQLVHYDSLKPFLEPPPTSNVPTRNKPRNFQSSQDRADTHKYIDGTLKHDDCLSFLPAPFSNFTPLPAVGRTTASVTPSRITPISSLAPTRREVTRSPPVFWQSSTFEQPSPQVRSDAAIQSPPITKNDIQPPTPDNDLLHERKSPRDNLTEDEDAAPKNFRRKPPANTSNMQLRFNTSSQRKAQPLFTTYLRDILMEYNSPERKISKQSDAKRIKVSTQTRTTLHQK